MRGDAEKPGQRAALRRVEVVCGLDYFQPHGSDQIGNVICPSTAANCETDHFGDMALVELLECDGVMSGTSKELLVGHAGTCHQTSSRIRSFLEVFAAPTPVQRRRSETRAPRLLPPLR